MTRLRLAALGWSAAFLAGALVAATGLRLMWMGTTGRMPDGLGGIALDGVLQLVALAGVTSFVARRTGLTREALRLAPWREGGAGALRGLGLGTAAALGTLGLASLVAGVSWSRDGGSFGSWIARGLEVGAALAPAALAEEVAFRGVPLALVALAFGRPAALVGVAGVLFAGAHLQNPGLTGLALGNLALAGILLGLAVYAPGGLWTAWGVHLGWNTALAMSGAAVSGLPITVPFLDYHARGPWWLTGGRFGPEGGIVATLALTLACLVAGQWARGGEEAR